MASFNQTGSLTDLQNLINEIYSIPDDRLYSVWDLLSNQERFTMRALKGIRKREAFRLKINLLISISWFLAIMNRFHIDIETGVWKRFPYLCSYCGKCPCVCKKNKLKKRVLIKRIIAKKPGSLTGVEEMFSKIYPSEQRTLDQAGIHLAEELGELSEAIHQFLGEHKAKHFLSLIKEAADFFSCAIGVANSAKLNLAREFARLYYNNCHVCHKAPCTCNFSLVAKFKS